MTAVRPLIWPARIVRPLIPRLVYLDLNHWIGLAKHAKGQPTRDGYDHLRMAIDGAKAAGTAVFPLSGTHYLEMSRIPNPAQRMDVATVMAEVSGFRVLLGRVTIGQLEIDAGLDEIIAVPTTGHSVPLMGTSVGWAFGQVGGLRISKSDGEDVTDTMDPEFLKRLNFKFEFEVLAGPSDEDEAVLRSNYGYEPERAWALSEERVKQEREQAKRLDTDPRWRRGRLSDVIGAREIGGEWLDQVNAACAARGGTIGELLGEGERIRGFADGMPSNRVAMGVKYRYHKNPKHRWTSNDIADIDALAVAVPYCDAVYSDNAARSALLAHHLDATFGIFLPRTPAQLAEWLEALPARARDDGDEDPSAGP